MSKSLDVFDDIAGVVPPNEIADTYLIGWKAHIRFTGFQRDLLKSLIETTEIPVGDLDGRLFSHKATLKAWLDERAKRNPLISD